MLHLVIMQFYGLGEIIRVHVIKDDLRVLEGKGDKLKLKNRFKTLLDNEILLLVNIKKKNKL